MAALKNSMLLPVQNPEIMYRSEALPEDMRLRLRQLGYAPHVTELLMGGLPIVYSEDGLVVEYPTGQRVKVRRHKQYDAQGEFQRYWYQVVESLSPAAR